jgi:hypothetical protein
VVKTRQQKFYSDPLGRMAKAEVLNWDGPGPYGTGGSVYSTQVTTYNALDEALSVRQYQGAESSGVFQDALMTYDGHGRLKTEHHPEQMGTNNSPLSTAYDYNTDDTVHVMTDARGATTTYTYNRRSATPPRAQTTTAGHTGTGTAMTSRTSRATASSTAG